MTEAVEPSGDITIQGRPFLLVAVGGGNAIHLVPADQRPDGRGGSTLCGRTTAMPAGAEAVPSCRTCLVHLDRLFPTPVPDPRIGLVAVLVVEAVKNEGFAEVVGVPGDQMPALRRAVRNVVKQQLDYSVRTYVVHSRLCVHCDEAYAPHAERHALEAARQLGSVFGDTQAALIDDTAWRFHWSAWATM